VRISLMN